MVAKWLLLHPMGTVADLGGSSGDVCLLSLGKMLARPWTSYFAGADLRAFILGCGFYLVVEGTANPTLICPSFAQFHPSLCWKSSLLLVVRFIAHWLCIGSSRHRACTNGRSTLQHFHHTGTGVKGLLQLLSLLGLGSVTEIQYFEHAFLQQE